MPGLASMGEELGNVSDSPDTTPTSTTPYRHPTLLQRRLKLQLLIRHYISQILWGCENSLCTTPTCLSCKKRLATEPFRNPTQLTARILAHYLAGQTNPEEGVCPNRLKASPRYLRQHHQAHKDVKSLSQNLFDTVSVMRTISEQPVNCENDNPPPNGHATRDDQASPIPESMNCDELAKWKDRLRKYHSPSCAPCDSTGKPGYSSCSSCRSLFVSLSDTGNLLRSFRETRITGWEQMSTCSEDTDAPDVDLFKLAAAFRDWKSLTDSLVFDALWVALESLFTPPPKFAGSSEFQVPHSTKSVHNQTGNYLTDGEAAHLVIICVHALASSLPLPLSKDSRTLWIDIRSSRSLDDLYPDLLKGTTVARLEIIDALEYEPGLRLAKRLVRGIGARLFFERELAGDHDKKSGPCFLNTFFDIVKTYLLRIQKQGLSTPPGDMATEEYHYPGLTTRDFFLDWLKSVILKNWDGRAEVHTWSSVGIAFHLAQDLYDSFRDLSSEMDFLTGVVTDQLDWEEEPGRHIARSPQRNNFHVFDCPWWLPSEKRVEYFRAVNLGTMIHYYNTAEQARKLETRFPIFTNRNYDSRFTQQMDFAFEYFLTLNVSSDEALKDALDRLWGQEKHLLLKPLKIIMGEERGELGQDHGGVTSEFFRVVTKQAFQPDAGMFTIDDETRMAWFQPASLEPDWKYEMLGLLFSLAVYNGITLPVTFPDILYHYIYNPRYRGREYDARLYSEFPVLRLIKQGWPAKYRSFRELLRCGDDVVSWNMGYAFGFRAFGEDIEVDMRAFSGSSGPEGFLWPADHEGTTSAVTGEFGLKWPASTPLPSLRSAAWRQPFTNDRSGAQNDQKPSNAEDREEIPLVTNANRHQFVEDYIYWLTIKSVAPQLEAFRKGFLTCLEPKSLKVLSPALLKDLVEGNDCINIQELRRVTTYDGGYEDVHPTIVQFWSIVEDYDMEDRRKLLAFVTASARIPVSGYEYMTFKISRTADSESLPTSSTCTGQLYLPEYSSKEKLKAKLGLAIANCEGLFLA